MCSDYFHVSQMFITFLSFKLNLSCWMLLNFLFIFLLQSQGTLYSKLSSFSPDKKYHHFAKQDTTAGPDQATCNVIVKTDPELKEQQRQQVSCSGNKMQGVGGPSLSRSNSGSALKNKSRGRRLSSELTRARSHSQTTPPIDDSGNDLTLTVDDIFSGKIGGTPLLKPIEGPEDPPVTTPTIKSPPVSKRSHVASSPKCTTPTTSTAVRGNIGNMTLRKELDAFSKVLNQVELKEKAKERCSPYGSVPPYPMGPSHLSSPTYMYPMATQQPHPLQPYNNMQSRQFTYENFPSNGGVQESPTYNLINSENRPHPQQHHYLPSTTLSQIGTLLNSPVTTLPSFDYPMPSTMAQTMGYHHNNQMYTNSNLYSNSLSHTPSPSRVRCGWGYSTQDPGGAPYMSNIVGQKRTLQPAGGQYAPPTKVPHSTISHLPLTDNPPPPPCYGSTTHIQYQPPSYNTHIS
jgi:hypothetical protein